MYNFESIDRKLIARPAHTPDTTPVDVCIWGHTKSVVCETPINVEEKLLARIVLTSDDICERPLLFRIIRLSIIQHYNLCIEHDGHHFEPF